MGKTTKLPSKAPVFSINFCVNSQLPEINGEFSNFLDQNLKLGTWRDINDLIYKNTLGSIWNLGNSREKEGKGNKI